MPGVYTVTEMDYDKYEPQESRRLTVVSGQVSTVTFNNKLKRGDLQIVKSSEDNLNEGVTFHLYPVTLGTDTFGNITRLDNALEGLPKRLEMNEMELDNLKKQFETAKVDVERPFPQEEELKAKTDRLNELNALLNVDKRENEIVGGEPDEGEEPPEKKPRDLER